MISKKISLYLLGFYELEIEGIFINRFINLLISKKIVIIYSKMEKSTILKCRCLKKDIEKVKEIAQKSNCLLTIKCEKGIPNFLCKYKKRKWLVILSFIVIIVIYIYSLFVWNINIRVDGENKGKENVIQDVEDVLEENDIQKGIFKYKINDKKEEMINKLKLKNKKIVWVGIKVEGTMLLIDVKVNENVLKIDENQSEVNIENESENDNNIYANKEGKIIKITVFSGTARKNVGDIVQKGDLIVEGVSEGKYKGDRKVDAKADIILEKEIIFEEEMAFETEIKEKTGNVENKVEIYINNFKINLNKGLLNFEKYDTIRENKRVKLFSKYYLPFEMSFIKYEEWKMVKKNYNKEELESIIIKRIEEKFNSEYDVSSFEKIDIDKQTKEIDGKLKLTLTYKVQEKIGTKRD